MMEPDEREKRLGTADLQFQETLKSDSREDIEKTATVILLIKRLSFANFVKFCLSEKKKKKWKMCNNE